MKTIKFFSVLSLVLIFAGVNAVYSGNRITNKPKQLIKVTTIRYEVNINFWDVIDLCNTYWVRVTDETGRLVAPAQIFVPGMNQYTFYSESKERALKERGSKRIAMLVISPYLRNLECENNLFTLMDVKTGLFLKGQIYSFDLFPL